MQNSGLGNAVNPLLSLTDPLVFGIPALLLIGWRGEPGLKDEPQHLKQGRVTLPLLETLGLDYALLPDIDEEVLNTISTAVEQMHSSSSPFALIAGKDSFAAYRSPAVQNEPYPLTREEALSIVLSCLDSSGPVVSTTGKLSREIYEYREKTGQGHRRDFLNIGSMGHASQIALAIALNKPDRTVYCLDGDGAVLMHMGALAIIGTSRAPNFKHIVFNNNAHDSVGGQPTVGFEVDLPGAAKACGYTLTLRAASREEIKAALAALNSGPGPGLLEIRLKKGAHPDLGRPKTDPRENKTAFMEFLS